MTLPEDIIGALPDPDVEIEVEEIDPLPSVISGGLPSPQEISGSLPTLRHRGMDHRVQHTHFTPDGKAVHCSCGQDSPLCGTDEDLELWWIDHA